MIEAAPGITSNVAEWRALIEAIRSIPPDATSVRVFGDSKLVVNQAKGAWKVKQEHLKKLHSEFRDLLIRCPASVTFTWIPREQNTYADELSNRGYTESVPPDNPIAYHVFFNCGFCAHGDHETGLDTFPTLREAEARVKEIKASANRPYVLLLEGKVIA